MKRVIKTDTNIDPLFKHIEDQIWATLSKYMHGPKGGFPKGNDEWKEYTRVEIGDYADDPSLIEVQVRSEFLVDFSSAIEASLYDDNIDVSVYKNLISTVRDNLNVLYDYYE